MRIEDEIQQSKFESEDQKLYVNLLYTASWLNVRHNKFFKTYGLSAQQYNVLRILKGQFPKPGNVNLLRERMIDKESNTSRLVDKLVLKNYVTRKPNEDDRRQVDVYITDKGIALLEEISIYLNSEHSVLSKISDKEMKQINDLLDKLRG